MTLRRVLLASVAVGLAALVVMVDAGPAFGGGSTTDFDRSSYRPGDPARGVAIVAWGHNSQLGRPEDGPYGVWLAPVDPQGRPGSWPSVPADGLYVGDLVIHEEPYVDERGFRYGPYHATIDFTVPDLPPGEYEAVHCNQPCTTTLGDIIWGRLTVSSVGGSGPDEGQGPTPPDRAGPATTTTGPTTTTASASTLTQLDIEPLVADSKGRSGPEPVLVVGLVVGGVAAATVVWRSVAGGPPGLKARREHPAS